MFYLFLMILSSWIMGGMAQNMTTAEYATYNKFLADQKRLYKDLFADYDPSLSAIYTLHKSQWIDQNATVHPPITKMRMTMAQIKLVDVVEVEEKVTFIFDYSAEWTDHRLKWNPLEYGGISHIYVPQKSIWLPELTVADASEVKYFESDDSPKNAWVNYNGTAGFYQASVVSIICQMDVYKFPLDHHECGILVIFHTYFPDEYEIIGGMREIMRPLDQLGNGEWKVTYIGVEPYETGNKELGTVQRFKAGIKRNPGFYIALVMIPAFFINFLSIIALFINVENVGEKIMIALTNIMAMTFILVILAADLPKTAKIPLLAIYVIVGLVIVMASIAAVLILPYVKKYLKKKRSNQNEKPATSRYNNSNV
ncbi:unnamed protein product [Caenorhabditis brenneri]